MPLYGTVMIGELTRKVAQSDHAQNNAKRNGKHQGADGLVQQRGGQCKPEERLQAIRIALGSVSIDNLCTALLQVRQAIEFEQYR